jgi:8-oxo-dGTP diphosphatase
MSSTTRVSAYGVCWRGAQLLLVHQVAPGPARNRWTLPGGGLNFGEAPRDAVAREVREETGTRAVVDRLLGVHDDVYDLGDGILRHGIRLLFAATVHGEPFAVAGDEIDEVAWHHPTDLPPDITAWALLAATLDGPAADRA